MSQTRPERNRGREKQRRDALKEAIESLQEKLLQHDETFSQEAHRRTLTTASRVSHTAKSVTNSEESWSFTKVEIINQASHTIQEVMAQNQEMKMLLLEIAKHPAQSTSILEAAVDLPSRPRAVFHQGVGPLVAVPVVAVPQEQPSKKRKFHEDSTATAMQTATAVQPLHHVTAFKNKNTTEPMQAVCRPADASNILTLKIPNNHHDSLIQRSAPNVREVESTPNRQPALVSDKRRVHSVAQPAELQALLAGASLHNRQHQEMPFSSTLGLGAQIQFQSSMNAAALATIQRIQQQAAAEKSATTARNNFLTAPTTIPVPFRGTPGSLVPCPTILDPNLRCLAAEYQQYSAPATTKNSTPPTN